MALHPLPAKRAACGFVARRGRSEIGALLLVALTAQDLEVFDGAGASHRRGSYVVVLKDKFAATLPAPPPAPLESGAAFLARDRLPPWPAVGCSSPFFDIEQHVCPIESLPKLALAVSHEGHHIAGAVAGGLPVEGVLEPPPPSPARLHHAHRLDALQPGQVRVPRHGVADLTS